MIDALRTSIALAFQRTRLPLAAYYAITLAVPFVNGAARSGMAFFEHSLVVLIVPPSIIVLAAAVAAALPDRGALATSRDRDRRRPCEIAAMSSGPRRG